MWEKWVKWRLEKRADDINEIEIINELKQGKSFFLGYDKKNNPVLVLQIRKHFPGQI